MGSGRFAGYWADARDALRLAFAEDHPPRVIAASFAFGVFLTSLPNLGTAVVVLGWIGYRVDRANRFALLAAVAVMNPVVKGAVYVASFLVGSLLLGPVPGITSADVGLDAGPAVLARLLVGNLLLALVFAVVGYGLAYRTARTYRRLDR